MQGKKCPFGVLHTTQCLLFPQPMRWCKVRCAVYMGNRTKRTSTESTAEAACADQLGKPEDHRRLWKAAKEGNLQDVRAALEVGDPNWRCDDAADPVVYKERSFTSCTALHAACARHPDHEGQDAAHEIVKLLLQKGARVDEVAHADGARKVQAIHIAAGTGNLETLKLLIAAKADPQAPCKRGERYYYRPIHDAAWFNQGACVQYLVEQQADIAEANSDGNTVLHFAARNGSTDIVRMVLEHVSERERIDMVNAANRERLNPMVLAVRHGRFPLQELDLFWNYMDEEAQVDNFIRVAKECPQKVPQLQVLFRDVFGPSGAASDEPISNKWRIAFLKAIKAQKITVGDLAHLLDNAPHAVGCALDTVTTTPEVVYMPMHPLPLSAALPLVNGVIRIKCDYVESYKWNFDRSIPDPHYPRWHQTLAPTDPVHEQEVKIKVVRLPGLLQGKLIHALAATKNKNEFIHSKPVVQAVLQYCWRIFRWLFFLDLLYESAATVAISLWVGGDIFTWPKFVPHLLWCVVASRTLLQSVHFNWALVSCCVELGRGGFWRWFKGSLFTGVMILSTMALVICMAESITDSEGCCLIDRQNLLAWNDILLAWNVLFHWLHLLCALRCFYATGSRLLPIMNSVQPLGIMLVIMFFICIAFAHAFWALDAIKVDAVSLYALVNHLLTGGSVWELSDLRAMGEHTRYGVMILSLLGIILFLITAINVFIAVLTDSYDCEKGRLLYSFSKNRARVCARYFLRPAFDLWPPAWAVFSKDEDRQASQADEPSSMSTFAKRTLLFICRVACCCWPVVPVVAVCRAPEPLALVSILAAATAFFVHGTIKGACTRGWGKKYLWFCYDAGFIEDNRCKLDFSITQHHQTQFPSQASTLLELKRHFSENFQTPLTPQSPLNATMRSHASSTTTKYCTPLSSLSDTTRLTHITQHHQHRPRWPLSSLPNVTAGAGAGAGSGAGAGGAVRIDGAVALDDSGKLNPLLQELIDEAFRLQGVKEAPEVDRHLQKMKTLIERIAPRLGTEGSSMLPTETHEAAHPCGPCDAPSPLHEPGSHSIVHPEHGGQFRFRSDLDIEIRTFRA